jgi:zinc-ribbon domain
MKASYTSRVSVKSDPTKPSAWIVNPSDRGRKSIKSGNKIYLTDGQNFEIEIHNPLTESVLADIKVNGKSVSKTGLVLRPAERFYLDCFIDDKKKFIFKTYEVENTSESKESIAKNGSVEVFFYKEETFSINNWMNKFDRIIEKVYYPVYYPHYYPYPVYPTYPTYPAFPRAIWGGVYSSDYKSPIVGSSNLNSSINDNVSYNSISSISNNVSQINDGSFNVNSVLGGNTFQAKYSADTNTLNTKYTSNTNSDLSSYFSVDKLETGRVEKGETSSQKFEDIDLDFEKYHISSVFYQILPESQKPVETGEVKKKFCSDCGQKLKGTEKFCPECGEKI